jgi:hypothetical protein
MKSAELTNTLYVTIFGILFIGKLLGIHHDGESVGISAKSTEENIVSIDKREIRTDDTSVRIDSPTPQ